MKLLRKPVAAPRLAVFVALLAHQFAILPALDQIALRSGS